jgi:hypothetical protein
MIACFQAECQTPAGCKCGRSWNYPVRLPLRKSLSEYSDDELRSEMQRRALQASNESAA